MSEKRAYKKRKPGGGRKKLKPEYDAGKNLKEQMESAAALYEAANSLQTIADELGLNPIKVRKLLITAGVYESDVADLVQGTFDYYRKTRSYKEAMDFTVAALNLSKSSVTSYLPYEKGVYFPAEESTEKLSVGAERQRRLRNRKAAVEELRAACTEENLWKCIIAFQEYPFHTVSGLPFSYTLKVGRDGEFTKELFIDRRENSKSLAWSSIRLAFQKVEPGKVYQRPKEIADVRGISYSYGLLWRFGVIRVTENVEIKLRGKKR